MTNWIRAIQFGAHVDQAAITATIFTPVAPPDHIVNLLAIVEQGNRILASQAISDMRCAVGWCIATSNHAGKQNTGRGTSRVLLSSHMGKYHPHKGICAKEQGFHRHGNRCQKTGIKKSITDGNLILFLNQFTFRANSPSPLN